MADANQPHIMNGPSLSAIAVLTAHFHALIAEARRVAQLCTDRGSPIHGAGASLSQFNQPPSRIANDPRPAHRKRTRPKNSQTLIAALQELLSGKTLTVTQAAADVQKAGYTTHSPNFRTIVNQVLLAHKRKFTKVARGQYTAANTKSLLTKVARSQQAALPKWRTKN